MNKYSVSINGCDDSNIFNISVTDDEYKFLLKLARLSRHYSSYSCQPTIEIGEAYQEEESE